MKAALMPNPYNRADLFEEAGIEVIEGPVRSTQDMIELLKDADGALVNIMPLTSREVLEACPRLKVVSRMGVGVDSIDLHAATELGVLACNVPGVNTVEVADHAMSLLLALTRRVVDSSNLVKKGSWGRDREGMRSIQTSVCCIAGSTMGIIGFGNIGRAFAQRIRGFGPAQIIAYDPYVDQLSGDLYGVRMVEFEELLESSDFVTIHCSATTANQHLIDERALSQMKSTAFLVNTARGSIVDGTALAEALRSGQIAAAALDVMEVEPIPADDPLLDLPNVILTPHAAGMSPRFLEECPIRQAENVIRVLQGSPPHGLANPEVIRTIVRMRSENAQRWENVPDFSLALEL